MADYSLWMWGSFLSVVAALLVLDLGVLNRKDRDIGIKESLGFSAFYMTISVIFGLFVAYQLGWEKAQLFYTGYVVEMALSLDNIFVISMVFSYFAIPRMYQHRVLFWGIIGVILLRGIMIGLGSTLIQEFSWILYIFAAFLVFTGIKMLISMDDEQDIGKNPIITFLRKHFRVTDQIHGHAFLVRQPDPKKGGQIAWFMTPLLTALIVVEFVDVIFAVDSVPAIFAITTDPYIVYTSNIFAILGLRSLYFALAAMVHRFTYLKYALAIVLVFIGGKIFLVKAFDYHDFPPLISLAVTVGLIVGGVLYSLYKTPADEKPAH